MIEDNNIQYLQIGLLLEQRTHKMIQLTTLNLMIHVLHKNLAPNLAQSILRTKNQVVILRRN